MDERYAETLRKQEAKRKEIEKRKMKKREQVEQTSQQKWICSDTSCADRNYYKIIHLHDKSGSCPICGKALKRADSETISKIKEERSKENVPFYETAKGIISIIAICGVVIFALFSIGSILSPDETTDSANYVDTTTKIDTNASNTDKVVSSDENTDYDYGWTTVTIVDKIRLTSGDEMYYQGYSLGFEDNEGNTYYVPDNLYNSKFINYAMKSEIKIKYHSGTGTANNGVTFPIYVVDDVKAV